MTFGFKVFGWSVGLFWSDAATGTDLMREGKCRPLHEPARDKDSGGNDMHMPSGQWDTRYEVKAVLLLCLGFGIVGLDRFMILPLYPTLMKELGLSYQDLVH